MRVMLCGARDSGAEGELLRVGAFVYYAGNDAPYRSPGTYSSRLANLGDLGVCSDHHLTPV